MESQKYIKECFSYDPKTGMLSWKERPRKHFKSEKSFNSFRQYIGKTTGCVKKATKHNSYYTIKLNQKALYAHRVIYTLHFGDNIDGEIDHIDGNGLNNRIDNLRCVSSSENSQNTMLPRSNKTGVIGVPFHKRDQVYRPQITVRGKIIYLGSYKCFDTAVKSRKDAEKKYEFHANHGRKTSICLPGSL